MPLVVHPASRLYVLVECGHGLGGGCPMALRLRALTDEERRKIERLANARNASARSVERARIIGAAAQGQRVSAIARQLDLGADTVRRWIKRFNAEGLDGLVDAP